MVISYVVNLQDSIVSSIELRGAAFLILFCPFSVYIDFVTDKAWVMLRRIDPTVLERTFEVKLTQIPSYSPMR